MSEQKGLFKADPDLYERMSAPYPTREEAEAALARFAEGVEKLRQECRIAEVLLVVGAYAADPQAPESALPCQGFQTFGDFDVAANHLMRTGVRQIATVMADKHTRIAAEYRAAAADPSLAGAARPRRKKQAK
mgnify:CR=1 FL=1